MSEEDIEEKVLSSCFVVQIFADKENSCSNDKEKKKIEDAVRAIFEDVH